MTFRLLIVLGMVALPLCAHAGGMAEFRDPDDGAFDISKYLLESKGALPMPIIITEPAVGYGGGLMIAFFQQSLAEVAAQHAPGGRYRPPNIYAVGGFGTENGTWGAMGGGMVSFREDRWRWRGGAAYTNLELTYYGLNGQLASGLDYNLKGTGIVNHLLYRLRDTRTWIVLRWTFLDFTSTFDTGNAPVPTIDSDRRSSGLGPSIEYDSRDTIFTPSQGWLGALDVLFYEPAFGSDESFQTYRGHVFAYAPIARRFVLGMRADARTTHGDVPFYQLPYIDLRGIAAARYQDQNTGVVEGELRFALTPRWALMGFAGVGRAWGSDDFADADARIAGGTGFRYFIARKLKMYSGVDFAWGPDDFAFYIQMGNAWR